MSARKIGRRDFLASGLVVVGAALAGPSLWRSALAKPAQAGSGPYGPLMPPDENGLMLPAGFSSREIARGGVPVLGTAHPWHIFPDGGATYVTPDGGWIYVSNSEVPGAGGAGALRFSRDGTIVDAYSILTGTSSNCAGGSTPWGTWLSCEETDDGRVWECDPTGARAAVVRPALGTFNHEAAAVDPVGKQLYLTEDDGSGRFYRFTPARYPDLVSGTLEAARVADMKAVEAGGASKVDWVKVPDPTASIAPTKAQAPGSTPFRGGEGCWYDSGAVYFTTKGDDRVWMYWPGPGTLELLYDRKTAKDPILSGVDNIIVSGWTGDAFIAEDGGDLDVVMITPNRVAARLLKLTGRGHEGIPGIDETRSEITGPALNPAGDRFYFSSQRGYGFGVTYEITGPFRRTRVEAARTSRAVPAPARRSPASADPSAEELPATGEGPVAEGAALLGAAAALGVAAASGAKQASD
jgi:secreted PhoX family phosphatase